MGQPNTLPSDNRQPLPAGGMILSSESGTGVVRHPPEVELATMRQMMEALFSRVEVLQQNQAVQFAGVHDRLDAVELELPLIQEQSALRIRNLETRMSVEIEEAARSAAEEAAAGIQEDVTGKFGSLAAQLEIQRQELIQMRESKQLTEGRLNRVVMDIERLCGNLGPRPAEEIYRPVAEAPPSPFRGSRLRSISSKAAVDAAPDDGNPLVGGWAAEKTVSPANTGADSRATRTANLPRPHSRRRNRLPDFPPPWCASRGPGCRRDGPHSADDESPRLPTLRGGEYRPGLRRLETAVHAGRRATESDHEPGIGPARQGGDLSPVLFRTHPARNSHHGIDALFRLAGFSPHRCRSCAHRFYKRGVSPEGPPLDDEGAGAPAQETVETR